MIIEKVCHNGLETEISHFRENFQRLKNPHPLLTEIFTATLDAACGSEQAEKRLISIIYAMNPPSQPSIPYYDYDEADQEQDNAYWSGMHVLKDFKRSLKFITAITRAVADQEEKFPDEKLKIVDLGCGASGFLGLIAKLAAPTAELFAYDQNDLSVKYAKQVVENLSRGSSLLLNTTFSRNAEFKKTDLCYSKYFDWDLRGQCHIVLSETIDPLCINEEYASFAEEYKSLLKPGGVFIPEGLKFQHVVLRNDQLKDPLNNDDFVTAVYHDYQTISPDTPVVFDVELKHCEQVQVIGARCLVHLYQDTWLLDQDSALTSTMYCYTAFQKDDTWHIHLPSQYQVILKQEDDLLRWASYRKPYAELKSDRFIFEIKPSTTLGLKVVAEKMKDIQFNSVL